MDTTFQVIFNPTSFCYEVSFWVDIPKIQIKNKLNMRVFKILKDTWIQDPCIPNSKYIFPLWDYFCGQKTFFKFIFDKDEFEKIKQFNFGLCDEDHAWILTNIVFINTYCE